MSEKTSYTDKDMVDVVDAEGNAIEGMPRVPKTWLDTDLVPAGTKKGKAKTADPDAAAGTTSTPSTQGTSKAAKTREPGTEPAKNASADEWVAYARERGAKDEDLLDDKAEQLTRDALIAKYGTPAS